jgi:hypothetical protein
MTLTTPLALLGLLTLPVIVALHALRARNERRVVSSLALWRFLDAQISGSRARRIPFTWLLLVDLLIATLLTLALAQPELALTRTVPNARHIIVLLDVSTSMAATDPSTSLRAGLSPTRFARARSDATDLLGALTPLDTATLISFAASAQTLADTRTSNLPSLIANLQSLTPGETGHNLPAALALADAARDPDLPLEIHLFTDAAFSFSPSLPRSTALTLHPYGTSSNNQSILTLAPSPLSAQKLQLFARFVNFADSPVTRRATLLADGRPVTSVDLTLDAHSSLPYTWDIVGTPTRLTVQLEGTDDLPADDSASLGLNTPPTLNVALIADDPAPVDRALAAIPNVTAQIISPTNYLPGSPFDLVIFKDTLPAEKPTSNALLLGLPGEVTPLDSSLIILQPHPFLTSLDFTGLRNLKLSTFNPLSSWFADYSFQPLLESEGNPLLLHGQTGLTQTTVFLADLDSGNLTQHPAFIILLNNILTYYRNLALPDQLALGESLHIPTGTGAALTLPNGDAEPLPATCPCNFPDTRAPGLYRLALTNPGGTAQTYWIGVNAGSLTESDITPNQWTVSSDPSSGVPSTLEEPIPLAPYLLAAVILLFFLEAYLAWK